MSRPNPVAITLFCLFVLAGLGAAALLKGALYVGKHEGDLFHLLEILFRMVEGQTPHTDFMTPIGVLSVAPIVWLMQAGLGVGTAIMASQVLVGAVLLPATAWAAVSRLSGLWAYLFCAVVMVLCTALIYGETEATISISMHYNRWAWALAYIAILLAVVPPRHAAAPRLDGAIIGLAMAALVLIKVTYFVAFAAPVALALVLRKDWAAIGAALLAGLLMALAATLWLGFDHWTGYLADLRLVSDSSIRPRPGAPLYEVLGGPLHLGPTLVALLAAIFLRKAGAQQGGLLLLLLFPGFAFVTFQNFGNDPQWLPLVAVIVMTLLPEDPGAGLREAVVGTAIAGLALAAPNFFNLVYSPLRHLGTDAERFVPVLETRSGHDDLRMLQARAWRGDVQTAINTPDRMMGDYWGRGNRPEQTSINDEPMPYCELQLGFTAWFTTIADDLVGPAGADGAQLFTADLFSAQWLWNDALEPLDGGAPWYYARLSGIENADYLVAPLCPMSPMVQDTILKELAERDDITLTEVRRTELYILYDIEITQDP